MIMNASKSRRKKKRSRAPLKPTTNNSSRGKPEDEGRDRSVCLLSEALEDVSLEEADIDVNKTVEIFATLSDNSEDPSTTSSVFGGSSCLDSGSTSGSSVGYVETRCVQNMFKKGASRQKRVVAVTGTVANVLGKEYVRANSRKAGKYKKIVDGQDGMDEQEVEQFLYSMLGEDSELSMAVVKDVLGQCGYNVGKALEALLDLSASSNEQYGNCTEDFNLKEDARFGVGSSDNLTEVSYCTSASSENDLYDNIWSIGFDCRNYSKVLTSEVSSKPSGQFDLPQKVLESLFNISKSPEHEPNSMNWRNVVKKLQSVGPRFDVSPSGIAESHQELCAKGDEYQVYRKDANLWWDSMKSSYQKATAAYSKGDWQYAAYLSDQGKSQTKLAQRADDKATQDVFKVRNRYIENVITIDLHGQHVKPAMKLLKLHLLLGSYVQSIQTLRVITGCGSHGVGKSKLKQSSGLHVGKETVRARVYVKKKKGSRKEKLETQVEGVTDSNGRNNTGKLTGEQSGEAPGDSNSAAVKVADRQQKYGDLLEKRGTLKELEAELARKDWWGYSEEPYDKSLEGEGEGRKEKGKEK